MVAASQMSHTDSLPPEKQVPPIFSSSDRTLQKRVKRPDENDCSHQPEDGAIRATQALACISERYAGQIHAKNW